MTAPLHREAVSAVDSTGQAAEILDLPAHLRDALWRVDSAGIPAVDAPGGVVVAGMGGSAVGGRLALAALGARLRRPFVVSDGYALPSWVGAEHLVLCSSYSGGTEETLSAYDDALERGAMRIVATTGGALAERARRRCATRSRRPPRSPRPSPPSGARTPPRTPRPSGSPARCTARCP
jgi:glucose/mannose-6-phosphate isomerase